MSRHHRDAEIQMAEEKTSQHHHSHHNNLNRKTMTVIDHLKTKVKRKRLSKHDSFALSDDVLNDITNINTNNNNSNINNQRLSLKHPPSIYETPLILPHSHSNTRTISLPNKQHSSSEDHIELDISNDVFIEKDEQDSVVPNQIHENEDPEGGSNQRQANHITFDMNHNIITTKRKSIQTTKSLPEMSSQSKTKQRRQTVRLTGFQIRDEDFNTIFRDLSSDEQLIIAFPCAWRKDVYMHGRMFLSANYISFYTCFFKWEESLCISYKDIINVKRKKSAKLVPNAIKIRTKNFDEYYFTSHMPREKLFVAIFRLWQNALLEQPLDYHQLRAVISSDQQSPDESSGDTEESLPLENTTESGPYSQSLPTVSNRSRNSTKRLELSNHQVISNSSDNEIFPTYSPTCTCETHLARIYADRLFTFNVDTLFELICGDNSFTRAFHLSQKFSDYTYGEWQLNNETGKRERLITYRTINQSILGTHTLYCQEKQILEIEKPQSMYVLSTEVNNEGIKYTDTFYVATRFCMTQRDAEHSLLKVTAEVKFIKNVNSFIKAFVEKNAYGSIENGVNEQVQRLEKQQKNPKGNRKSILMSKQHIKNSIDDNITQQQIDETSSTDSIDVSKPIISFKENFIISKDIFYNISFLLGICLLFVHIYLCYKLYFIDEILLNTDAACTINCKQLCLKNKMHQ